MLTNFAIIDSPPQVYPHPVLEGTKVRTLPAKTSQGPQAIHPSPRSLTHMPVVDEHRRITKTLTAATQRISVSLFFPSLFWKTQESTTASQTVHAILLRHKPSCGNGTVIQQVKSGLLTFFQPC